VLLLTGINTQYLIIMATATATKVKPVKAVVELPENAIRNNETFFRTKRTGIDMPDEHVDICPVSFRATRKDTAKDGTVLEKPVTGWDVTFHPEGEAPIARWFDSGTLIGAGVTKHVTEGDYHIPNVQEMGMSVKDNGRGIMIFNAILIN
jgi:hypothetical protein